MHWAYWLLVIFAFVYLTTNEFYLKVIITTLIICSIVSVSVLVVVDTLELVNVVDWE